MAWGTSTGRRNRYRKSKGLTAFRSTLLAGCAGIALTGTALLVPTTIGAELPAGVAELRAETPEDAAASERILRNTQAGDGWYREFARAER